MNLTWHIVKKDLRALKWPLGLWILLVSAKLGVGVAMLNADGTEGLEWFTRMDALAKVLSAFEFVSFVLTAAIIQQDLLVGTTAFWMTRPISGVRLLRAKLLGLGLVFIVAPVLVTLPWWLGCSYGISEIAWAVAETVAVQAIAVLLGLLWSVVTDGFARFLMWTLVTLFATPMLTAIITRMVYRRQSGVVQELVATRFMLALILAVAGISVVVVHQFLTRHTWRSIAIIGTTVLCIVCTGSFWPWPMNVEGRLYSYLLKQAAGEWPVAAKPPGLTFTLASVEFSARKDRPDRPGTLTTKYQVDGLSDSQGLMSIMSEHNWRWPDGSSLGGRSSGRSGLAEMMSRSALTGEGRQTTAGQSEADNLVFINNLRALTMGKVRAEPPAYVMSARFRLMRFESATRVPLQPGAWSRHDGYGERVAAVEKEGHELLVTYIRHMPSLWVDNAAGGQLAASGPYSQYYLVNRARDFVHRGSSRDFKLTRIGTVGISWSTMAYFPIDYRGPAPTAGRAMLEAISALNDVELVKVTYTEQARFSHELKLDPAEIAKANP